jgi:hypothetical protein
MSKVYRNLISSKKSSTVCTLAFCKELLIRIRPELENIFMIIKNSEVLYYMYFFLYILQHEKHELCWQVTLQHSFFLGFKAFLYAVIKPELNYYLVNLRERKVIQTIVTIQNYIKLISSQERVALSKHQEVIRRIFVYYQSGFNFKYFNHSFFYWTAKIAILLRIFTRLDWESIRTLKEEDIYNCIKELTKEGRSSYISQYQIILDLCPIEVISHFLRLRKKLWKSSNFVFAGSISGVSLTSESLNKIVSIQLGNIELSKEDLDSIKGACVLSTNLVVDPKPFDKTSNILFWKYSIENKSLKDILELKKQEIVWELTQSLYNTPSDERLNLMMNGFVSLELLNWQQRNVPSSSSKEVF